MLGWLLSFLLFVVLAYYDPNFRSSAATSLEAETVPQWVWLLGAICTFGAHQLDGCDGKQARRTDSRFIYILWQFLWYLISASWSTAVFWRLNYWLFIFSSPLGELFDHGLDSSAVFLMGICILSLFGTGPLTAEPWEMFCLITALHFAFYVAHWEKYNTNVLFLPWAYDVSQLVSIVIVDVYRMALLQMFCFIALNVKCNKYFPVWFSHCLGCLASWI